MTKKITRAGLLVALALLLSYIENFLPLNPGIPGLKLGLANLVTLTAFYFLDIREVLAITLIRILFTGFFAANLTALLFSLAGGCCSFLAMLLALRTQLFSPMGVSLVGGAVHNLAQLGTAVLLLQSSSLLSLLPLLLLAGILTGALNGLLALGIIRVLQKNC